MDVIIVFFIVMALVILVLYLAFRKKGDSDKEAEGFLLKDSNLARNQSSGKPKNDIIANWPFGSYMGHALVLPPFEAFTRIDYTAAPGATTGLYYSLCFQLGKWEYNRIKADEWIEVSPVHAQYYQLTHKQKEDLENKIKAGLTSVAQSVADMELLMHDQRKYTEFLHYLGYRTKRELDELEKKKLPEKEPDDYDYIDTSNDSDEKKKAARIARIDHHSLKAVFIDQVDMHTGEGISIRSIVGRWPTLITDFMRMNDEDLDTDKVKAKIEVSKAEAVVLVTKNKLYREWRRLFEPEIKNRYENITTLVKSRKKSVEEYREWLKPYIARHKLITEGLGSGGLRKAIKTLFIQSSGNATSMNEITLWTWKDVKAPEIQRGGRERMARDIALKKLTPYDDWVKKNLIFHPVHGLIKDYPWITEDWVKEQLKDMYDSGWINDYDLYICFMIIKIEKTNIRLASGAELEDAVFDVNAMLMSHNALFAKLLEAKAKEVEFERYVNQLMGLPPETPGGKIPDLPKEKDRLKPIRNFFDYFGMPFKVFKKGPYERDFEDRITKLYLAPMAGIRYGPVVNFLKKKIGFGVS